MSCFDSLVYEIAYEGEMCNTFAKDTSNIEEHVEIISL